MQAQWVVYLADADKYFHIPSDLAVVSFSRSLKASRGEHLQIEEPVACRDSPAFHSRPTLTRMLSTALIGHQIVQMGQPLQKRLLAPVEMMEPFHREQFPLDGVVGLI